MSSPVADYDTPPAKNFVKGAFSLDKILAITGLLLHFQVTFSFAVHTILRFMVDVTQADRL
jgi:hypothetical protein